MEPKKVSLRVRLPQPMYEELKQAAENQERSLNAQALRCLRRGLEAEKKDDPQKC